MLSELGYENAWWSYRRRTIYAALEGRLAGPVPSLIRGRIENGLGEHEGQDHFVSVQHRDDEIRCPKCGEKAIKLDYPSRPMPTSSENGKAFEVVTDALGQVYCKSCDHTYFWEYLVAP